MYYYQVNEENDSIGVNLFALLQLINLLYVSLNFKTCENRMKESFYAHQKHDRMNSL